MGGGVGISEPADVRIATERTNYAMPETGIGLFPDVGGGWFLPRLSGQTGVWLALTGARLKAADTVALGIHTHFVASDAVEALKAELLANPSDPKSVADRVSGDAGEAPLNAHREAIDRLFGFDRVEDIFAALEADGSEWALKQLSIRGREDGDLRRQYGDGICAGGPYRLQPRFSGGRPRRHHRQGQCAELAARRHFER